MHNRNYEPLPLEKIISALSYLTMGMAGFVWMIIGALMKLSLRPFLAYHIYQSIFISILFFLLSFGLKIILDILGFIPLIGTLLSFITFYLSASIIGNLSIIDMVVFGFIAYLAVTALSGKLSYVPWVSDIIKANLNR